MSLDDFSSTDSSSESSESGEFEMVSIVRPYADEPLAHSSDQKEDDENDQDGLSSAILRGRFQDEVPVNDWLVITICIFRFKMIDSPLCAFCQTEVESPEHLFFHCNVTKSF